ncbi:MAG: SagB/ThcOx family dehydrogenase [Candidatus Moranbacteria bacterium]|nr:SagB/ThcOx family dehydrogenase [Candidatus Moranbacteria bacterium]MBP9801491.1 SagB/ThcOx family dehydrogenase [Candidatus Moranbacteria bacterium]
MSNPSFLYAFFHNETVDRSEKGLVNVPKDPRDWPEEWKKIEYKTYHLFQPVALPQETECGLWDLLLKRRSSTAHFGNNVWTIEKLSSVLRCGYGLQGDSRLGKRQEHRTVPSAGKRYPLEIYVFLFKPIGSVRAGIYHYGVKKHALEILVQRTFSKEEIAAISPQEFLYESWGMICMTGLFKRTTSKYGSRGYRFVLLEAGHVAQNMLLAGTEKGVNLIPVGGTNENVIEGMMGLGTLEERIVYTLFL